MSGLEIFLALIALLVPVFAIETLYSEFMPAIREYMRQSPLIQSGDSSLSPRSVNWLGAAAFGSAVFICFVLI